MTESPVLEVDGLTVEFPTRDGRLAPVVRDVSLSVNRGQVLGIVGESGSGKTMVSLSIIDLVPAPGRVTAGSIAVAARRVRDMSAAELRSMRGGTVGLVFQDPMASLNPVRTVGAQLVAQIRRHQKGVDRGRARELAARSLAAASIPHPEDRLRSYPHQLSGGLRQRAMIALATANDPQLLIADEPTTALDATIQAQVADLLKEGVERRATILVTHDLGFAAAMCTDLVVMYAGRILEEGPAEAVLSYPRHPYTRALLDTVPRLGRRRTVPQPIAGQPPAHGSVVAGCAFRDRCPHAHDACAKVPPLAGGDGHRSACWLP